MDHAEVTIYVDRAGIVIPNVPVRRLQEIVEADAEAERLNNL